MGTSTTPLGKCLLQWAFGIVLRLAASGMPLFIPSSNLAFSH